MFFFILTIDYFYGHKSITTKKIKKNIVMLCNIYIPEIPNSDHTFYTKLYILNKVNHISKYEGVGV